MTWPKILIKNILYCKRMHRRTWTVAGSLCDKYHNLMSWLLIVKHETTKPGHTSRQPAQQPAPSPTSDVITMQDRTKPMLKARAGNQLSSQLPLPLVITMLDRTKPAKCCCKTIKYNKRLYGQSQQNHTKIEQLQNCLRKRSVEKFEETCLIFHRIGTVTK